MATMTVSLPDALTRWIEAQVEAGHYAGPSDYVEDLVRRDRERKDGTAALHDLIAEAEASGISPRGLDEIFAEAEGVAKKCGLLND